MDTLSANGPIDGFLGRFVLLAEFKSDETRRLTRGAARYDLPRGRILFRQGDACVGLHLVLSGQVKLSVQTARGDEKVIELVGPGGSLGQVAILMNQPYHMTAEVIADSSFIELSAEAVREQLGHNANFLRCMLHDVCRRLYERTRDLQNCLLLNGTQRVADFLLRQVPASEAAGAPVTVTLPAKKSIIASRLNLTHEHFSRILHDIQSAGVIQVHGRQINLLDVARLRTFPG